jgi:hypothetical protein
MREQSERIKSGEQQAKLSEGNGKEGSQPNIASSSAETNKPWIDPGFLIAEIVQLIDDHQFTFEDYSRLRKLVQEQINYFKKDRVRKITQKGLFERLKEVLSTMDELYQPANEASPKKKAGRGRSKGSVTFTIDDLKREARAFQDKNHGRWPTKAELAGQIGKDESTIYYRIKGSNYEGFRDFINRLNKKE